MNNALAGFLLIDTLCRTHEKLWTTGPWIPVEQRACKRRRVWSVARYLHANSGAACTRPFVCPTHMFQCISSDSSSSMQSSVSLRDQPMPTSKSICWPRCPALLVQRSPPLSCKHNRSARRNVTEVIRTCPFSRRYLGLGAVLMLLDLCVNLSDLSR